MKKRFLKKRKKSSGRQRLFLLCMGPVSIPHSTWPRDSTWRMDIERTNEWMNEWSDPNFVFNLFAHPLLQPNRKMCNHYCHLNSCALLSPCAQDGLGLTSSLIVATSWKRGQNSPFYRWVKRGSQRPISSLWTHSQRVAAKHHVCLEGLCSFLPLTCSLSGAELGCVKTLYFTLSIFVLCLKNVSMSSLPLPTSKCTSPFSAPGVLWEFHGPASLPPHANSPATVAILTSAQATSRSWGTRSAGTWCENGACSVSAGSAEDVAWGPLFAQPPGNALIGGTSHRRCFHFSSGNEMADPLRTGCPEQFVLWWCRFQPLNFGHLDITDIWTEKI